MKMYRNIVWFYVFVLTLLDLSLNTKLSAQGKSQEVQIHDTLVEGITFQEWGSEAVETGARARGAAEGVVLRPAALSFGHAALATAHARSVTLTNAANATLHLASVAGTTPDFHASFFESKTLAPQSNTTFSVVYLGRREGPVSAHLYIHTSLGVYKYPVSAVGVASEWGLWPLVGVRVPLNATLEPLLTMHNPTDQTVQVSEVYSSGGWLGLQLPEGGRWAPRDRWTLPPHSSRDIVRLRLQPPHQHAQHQHQHPLTAYIRIKANMSGGGLVVGVEARGVPPGEYLSPIQLPLTARGSRDPPDTFPLQAGSSLAEPRALDAAVWGARCSPAPPHPPPPPHTHTHTHTHNTASVNGGAGGAGGAGERDGVRVSLVRTQLDAHQPLTHAALLTLDYSQMWAAYSGAGAGAGGGEGAGAAGAEAWCAGWARVGRAALPYSLRLLPGTLALLPDTLHFISSLGAEAKRAREVRVRNEFPVPVHVAHAHCPPRLLQHFHCETLTPLVVAPGERAVVARLRVRTSALTATVASELTLRTNLTQYTLPVLLYSGRLDLEWEWPNSSDGTLRMGAVGTSSTRRVPLHLHNRGPAPLCVTRVHAAVPGAQVALAACANVHPLPEEHPCRCVPAGASARAWVTVVAPARTGPLRGDLEVHTAHAQSRVSLELHAHAGRVSAHALRLPPAAPYAWSSAPIILESSMSLRMRVVNITQPVPEPAVTYVLGAGGGEGEGDGAGGEEISPGRHTVGELVYKPEHLCHPNCYTGLDISTPEGAAWVRRADAETQGADEAEGPEAAGGLDADAALQVARYALYARSAHAHDNFSLHLHTTQVVQVPVQGSAGRWWPRLVDGEAGGAGLAAVGASLSYKISVRNPSRSHPVLLQPVLAHRHYPLGGADESSFCKTERCVRSRDAFRLAEWSGARGEVREWRPGNHSARLPVLLVSPDAEVDIRITFTPKEPSPLAAYLYLRNNLTILESVELWGRGAYPSFELGGRRPGTNAPILFEVHECAEGSGGEAGAGAGAEGGVVRRTVVARNTGPVPVRLRDWRLAGAPCQARGFRLQPCAPLTLAPNESRALHLAFAADYSLARVPCRLRVRAGTASAEFALLALAPAALLPRCAPRVHRPPFEPALRAAGTLLALLGLALVLAAAAIDAERELRRVRPPRSLPPDRAPLDLRALAHPVPAAPAPRAPPRRRRQPRRAPAPNDPHAERRAFERWRSRVLRAADDDEDDDSRSSEDLDADREPLPQIRSDAVDAHSGPTDRIHPDEDDDEDEEGPPAERDVDPVDGYEADPETEERPDGLRDEDAISTDSASASSSPADERDEDGADDGNAAGIEVDTSRERIAPPDPSHRHGDGLGRGVRPRRDAGEPRRARTDTEGGGGGRARVARQQARRDKGARRRTERTVTPTRDSPARGPGEARAPAVRWGASWSEVVAAGAGSTGGSRAPLPPIGSDVRRRAEPAVLPADNSLFFFNGETIAVASAPAPAPAPRLPDPEFAWRARPDYLEENSGTFRSMGSSVWGGGAEAWGGWGAALRPPPGFPAAPPPARVYDPFHSLSAIWAPNVLHWNDSTATSTAATNTANTTGNTSTGTGTGTAGPGALGADDTRQDSPR